MARVNHNTPPSSLPQAGPSGSAHERDEFLGFKAGLCNATRPLVNIIKKVTRSGEIIYGTSPGAREDKSAAYKHKILATGEKVFENQDGVIISPDEHGINALLDGLGVSEVGCAATNIVLNYIEKLNKLNWIGPLQGIADETKSDLHQSRGATVGIFWRTIMVDGQEKLEIKGVGDCHALLLRLDKTATGENPKFKIEYDSERDALNSGETAIKKLRESSDRDDGLKDFFTYISSKNVVNGSLGYDQPITLENSFSQDHIDLVPGDVLLVVSDGIGDNFSSEELCKIYNNCKVNDKNFANVLFELNQARIEEFCDCYNFCKIQGKKEDSGKNPIVEFYENQQHSKSAKHAKTFGIGEEIGSPYGGWAFPPKIDNSTFVVQTFTSLQANSTPPKRSLEPHPSAPSKKQVAEGYR